MTPLKETLEVGEAQVSSGVNRPKPDSGQLRSDAVSLDVPVKVHGSRVVEVVRGTTSHTEPFEEQTSTMIVFPLGGVLKMTTLVSVGQAVVLTNLKTRQDAICRVIKIRTNPNLHSYVEVEFSHPQPGYWGVRFPSDPAEPPKKAPTPAVVSAPAIPNPPTAISAPPAKVESPKAEAPKIEAPRVEIKEPKPIVTPPLAASPAQVPAETEKLAQTSKSIPEPKTAGTPEDEGSFSLDQLRGDATAHVASFSTPARVEPSPAPETSHSAATPAAEESASGFGRFAASGDQLAARPAFGASFEYSKSGATGEKTEAQAQGKNWAAIAAVVLLIAAAGGGGFYFLRMRPAAHPAPSVAAISQAPVATAPALNPSSVAASPVQPATAGQVAAAAPVTAPANPPAKPSPVEIRSPQAASRVDRPAPSRSAETSNQPSRAESARQNSAAPVPDMFGALNAHPTAAVRAGSTEGGAAPSIEGSALAGQSVALPSSEPSPANLAPPPPPPAPVQAAPEGPVPVGGDVPAPRALTSPAVVYPEIARQAGVEGDVVVRIVIDKTGNVTSARALSGPIMLRDAATGALRARKYVPSKLNGHPISVEMLVTIQFRR